MKHIIHLKKRPFIYAFIVSVGFAFLIDIVRNTPALNFITATFILYIVLLFELFSTYFYASELLTQYKLPPVESNQHQIQFIHHILLPSIIFFSMAGFIFFNSHQSLDFILLIINFALFSVLFTNIRAFYEDKFKLEALTHTIYDIFNIIGVFLFTSVTLNTLIYFGFSLYFTPFILILFITLLAFIVLIRYRSTTLYFKRVLAVLILFSVIIVSISIALKLSLFIISFSATLLFYYFLAFLNHKLEDSFSKEILFEYVIVFCMMFVLIVGIS